MITRAEREKYATDETQVYQHWHQLHDRFAHIFTCPNSQRAEYMLDTLLRKVIVDKRVLEIGCGAGAFAERLTALGAAYVYATDISETRIAEAKVHELPGVREYVVADVSQPLAGQFDLILGRAVLHHLDYQEVLCRLRRHNLAPGGIMLFYEPLADNWLMRLFRRVSKHAHTSDERAFDHCDLAWIRQHFAQFYLIPFNFISIPLGALSSLVFPSADNALLGVADMLDWFLAQHVPWLYGYFRIALLVFPT